MEILLASHNQHKIVEIREILKGLPIQLRSMDDFPDIAEVEETGSTFEENALLKAREVHRQSGLLTLSDDSGLEVDALNGAPGVYSARYAGEAKSTAANNEKLLWELAQVPPENRGAQFRCVVAIVADGFETTVEGIARGKIIADFRGDGGFGYDPLFVPEDYSETFAELGAAVKNRISHRAKAFLAAKEVLQKQLNLG